MRIVHLSTSNSGGGAFRAAYRLHSGLRRLEHDSRMLVLKRGTSDDTVTAFKPRQDFIGRQLRKLRGRRIYRDYEAYRPTIPNGIEPFSDSSQSSLSFLVMPTRMLAFSVSGWMKPKVSRTAQPPARYRVKLHFDGSRNT